jgi:hypothetical protein
LNKLSLKNSKIVSNKIIQLDEPEQKDPFKAGCISFFLPGFAFGQLYNEQNWKFYRHIGITGGCAFRYIRVLTAYQYGRTRQQSWGMVGNIFCCIVLTGLGALVMVVPVDNKQIRLQKYRSDVMNRIKLGFNVDMNKQLKINFAFEL